MSFIEASYRGQKHAIVVEHKIIYPICKGHRERNKGVRCRIESILGKTLISVRNFNCFLPPSWHFLGIRSWWRRGCSKSTASVDVGNDDLLTTSSLWFELDWQKLFCSIEQWARSRLATMRFISWGPDCNYMYSLQSLWPNSSCGGQKFRHLSHICESPSCEYAPSLRRDKSRNNKDRIR